MNSVKAHFGIALVMDEQEVDIFAEHYADETGENLDEVLENIMFCDPLPQNHNKDNPALTINEICNDNVYGGIEFFNWGKNGECESQEKCWAVFADNQLIGQNIFAQTPYTSMDSLIAEFKSKLCKYLPRDFDYQSHIGFLAYCAVS